MSDREKIVAALENCSDPAGKCKDCPYEECERFEKSISEYPDELIRKAVELLKKSESQFRAMCDLSNMQMETLHEQEHTISELENAAKSLELIADIAFDYDGADTVEGLKSLIDEIREIAIKGVQKDDEG